MEVTFSVIYQVDRNIKPLVFYLYEAMTVGQINTGNYTTICRNETLKNCFGRTEGRKKEGITWRYT